MCAMRINIIMSIGKGGNWLCSGALNPTISFVTFPKTGDVTFSGQVLYIDASEDKTPSPVLPSRAFQRPYTCIS